MIYFLLLYDKALWLDRTIKLIRKNAGWSPRKKIWEINPLVRYDNFSEADEIILHGLIFWYEHHDFSRDLFPHIVIYLRISFFRGTFSWIITMEGINPFHATPYFYTPWKHQKTSRFFMFSGCIEKEYGIKWVK